MIRSFLVACVAMTTAAASADTITVCASGCDHTSINDAIAAASDGDVIQLAAETYREGEQIEIIGRSLTLRGPANPTGEPLAIIDGQGDYRVLNATNANLTLEQITFVHGYASPDGRLLGGGGIRIASSSAVIRECVIEESLGGPGGGIHLDQSTTELFGCRITGNSTLDQSGEFPTGGGGGGLSQHGGFLSLTQCEIRNNYAGMGSGGAINSDSELLIYGSTIDGDADDGFSETYGGLSCNQLQMWDSVVLASSSIQSGMVVNSDFMDFRGPSYSSCSCCSSGGSAIFAGSSHFRSCTFSNLSSTNTSPVHGGRSYEDCIFDSNRSSAAGYGAGGSMGGALRTREEEATFSGCLFINNSAVYGGALYASDATITNCDFKSNVSFANPDGWCFTPEPGGGGAVLGYNCTIIACLFDGNASSGPGSVVAGNENMISGSRFCGDDTDWIDGDWHDLGENTFSLTCPSPCPGDFDGDGVITGADLGAWLLHAGDTCEPDDPCPGDLDGDGEVRGSDLGVLLANWGLCP